MTTAQSPLRELKRQADKIAEMLKRFERGEKVEVQFVEKMEAARGRESFKFAVVMDDKIITVDMPWKTVRETSEVGIAEYILKQMRGAREVAH